MITKAFPIKSAEKEASNMVGALLFLGLVMTGAASFLIEASAGPLVLLGLIAAFLFWEKCGPAQTIITTLESDGLTLWAFNERRPDVQRKGRCKLFAVPLDQVGGCEIGNAFAIFGGTLEIGAQTLLKRAPSQAAGAKMRAATSIVYLRLLSRLAPVAGGVFSNALSYEIMNEINSFLDDARALRGPPVADPAASFSAAPAGFDL